MAERFVYHALTMRPYVEKRKIQFEYFGGFSLSQKRRCIDSLQSAYSFEYPADKILEISSKSPETIGVDCSAFNLIMIKDNLTFSVESAFQSSKVFENGGPFCDLLYVDSKTAKRDQRLRESGRIIGFEFFGQRFPTKPLDAFYNWLYINALYKHNDYIKAISQYDAFTDIEFNPKRSINCQAIGAAICVGLTRAGILYDALHSFDTFRELVYGFNEETQVLTQESLF